MKEAKDIRILVGCEESQHKANGTVITVQKPDQKNNPHYAIPKWFQNSKLLEVVIPDTLKGERNLVIG